jgi:hypothetical protein
MKFDPTHHTPDLTVSQDQNGCHELIQVQPTWPIMVTQDIKMVSLSRKKGTARGYKEMSSILADQ